MTLFNWKEGINCLSGMFVVIYLRDRESFTVFIMIHWFSKDKNL